MGLQRYWQATGAVCAVSAVLVTAAGAAMAAAPIALVSHRAVYDITLDRTSAGSGVAELSGRMVYELKGNSCKGYEQTIRFVTRTENPKGKSTITDLRSLYWENADATKFRFETSQFQNDQLTEETVGNATRASPTAPLSVTIKKPKNGRQSMPGSIMLPVQHSREILNAARAGKRVFTSDLYDGSEKGTKIYETTAIVGERRKPGYDSTLPPFKAAGKSGSEVLQSQPAWPVSLSYFNRTQKPAGDEVPVYELAFMFYENGVSRKLLIDYGEFAIRGTLSQLEMLDPGTCPAK
ncbi:MAG TPA: cell envelope integrity EipB family protein [Hyphomicrobiaceae bacterium]|nr:cell envelope integrity EipB family protein [Hyphomicrobiaceae bacterium]